MGLALLKGVERMNAVIVYLNHRVEFALCNLYAINLNKGNRNCYNCGGFGHLARSCRNRNKGNRIGKRRRLKYGNNKLSNLNGGEDLIVLD